MAEYLQLKDEYTNNNEKLKDLAENYILKIGWLWRNYNEIKELKRQDGIFTQKLDKARIEQHDMESEVQGLEINLQQQFEQKNRITEDEIEAEKTIYKAGEDLKNTDAANDLPDLVKALEKEIR